MGIFSGLLENFAERQFAKDDSGRLVFLPRGARRTGYFVADTDESKFKSLVKVYGVAGALINLTGSVASLAFTQALTFDDRYSPPASRLKFGLIAYAISSMLLYIGPALIFWNVYRGVLAGLCSPLTAVDPSSLHLAQPASNQRRVAVILILVVAIILAIVIEALVSYRR
jgi:hypothetical protein